MTTESKDEQALARVLALEPGALAKLEDSVREASPAVEKDAATDLEAGLALLVAAVGASVLALRASTRVDAAASVAVECGVLVLPSSADDAERGAKAGAYYARAWEKGLGKEAPDWPAAVAAAFASAADALRDVAAFEVFDAWNDEHLRAAAAINAEAKDTRVKARWKTKRDDTVCAICEQMDRKVAGDDGLFKLPNGKRAKPPLHRRCRCIVVVDAKALGEESEDMATQQQTLSGGAARAILGDALRAGDRYFTDAEEKALNSEPVTTQLHVKAIDEQKRTVDFVASTDVLDAHDEVIDQGSWVLDDYLKNPVVLFAHDSRELPIGRAVDVAVRMVAGRTQLECRIEFASAELNPKAEQVFQMLRAKFLRAVSVGFVPRSYRWEMRNNVEVWVWADCVLKEISVTPVPANPEALAKMKSLSPRPARGEGTAPPAVPGPTVKHGALPRKEESAMDIKELQEKAEKNAVTIATLESEQKALEARAAKAEASVIALEAQTKTLETTNAALEAQTKSLVDARDAAVARAEKAEGAAIELEVDALVGKKITPAERPLFVDLRKSNPDLFAKMIEQRQDLALTEGVTMEGAAKNGKPEPIGANGATKAIALVEQLGS